MGLPEDKDKVPVPTEGVAVAEQVTAPAQYADVPAIAVATKNAMLLESGKFPKSVVLDMTRSFFAGVLADEDDRTPLVSAIEYMYFPTDNFEDIKLMTTKIGTISAMSYYAMDLPIPPALEALQAYFYGLQVVNRMNFVESELAKGVTDSREIEDAITQALADAQILAGEDFKDSTLLEAATALHDRLPEVVRKSMADRKLANVTIRKAPFNKDPTQAN
jgi:hypothetical protein